MNAAIGQLSEHRRPDYRRYWLALYRRDVQAAWQIVEHCLGCWPPRRIYLRLFEPALNFSGALFGIGRISYADEHFVTWHTVQFLRQVRRQFVQPCPTGPLALAMGVGQESHLIGLRMVCDFLQHDNWRIAWLASNDRATVRDAAARLEPAAILLSIGLDDGIPHAQRLIADLRRHGFNRPVVIGGGAVNRNPSLVHSLGADLTAANGLELARRLRTYTRAGMAIPET